MRTLPLGALVCALPLFASDLSDERRASLETVVVTGTRTERLLIESPVKTEVVTRAMIEASHASDVSEALRLVPGLFIRTTHGKQGEEVWMQGFDSDRILVLIDGRPPAASTGATVDLTQLSLVEVERIEVVKGATSALYGSSAMGGVVNIITRRPTEDLQLAMEMTAGSWLDKAVDDRPKTALQALASQKSGSFFWRLGGSYRFDPGYAYEDGFAQNGQESERVNLNAQAGVQVDSHRVYVQAEQLGEDKLHPTTELLPGLGYRQYERIEDVESLTLGMGGEHRFDAAKVTWNLSDQNYESESIADKLATATYYDDARNATIDLSRGEIQVDLPIGDAHLISLGAVGLEERFNQTKTKNTATQSVDTNELGGAKNRENTELFAQYDWFATDRLEILPGVRYQEDSNFGSYVAPKLNLLYGLYKDGDVSWSLRAGIGTGYRVPTLKERYYEFDQSQHGYKVLGNPELEPETSQSVQAGIEGRFGMDGMVELSVFDNRIRQMITTANDPVLTAQMGLTISQYQNVDKARTRGGEFSWQWQMVSDWALSGGYTYLMATDESTGKQLANRPEHQIKVSLDYRTPRFEGVALLSAQGEEFYDEENLHTSPAYQQIDLKGTWHLTPEASLLFGVENAGDVHQDPGDIYDVRPKEGRFAYAGFRLKI